MNDDHGNPVKTPLVDSLLEAQASMPIPLETPEQLRWKLAEAIAISKGYIKRCAELENQLSEVHKDIAEWHPVQECAEEIHKLRTALERVRDEIDFSFDKDNPDKIRAIALEALGNPPAFP